MSAIPRNLEHLAKLYGVQTAYLDMRGRLCNAPVESLLAVARTLGADVSSLDQVDKEIAKREEELWERAVEPVIVAWDGKIPAVRIRTRTKTTKPIRALLTLEDGTTEEFSIKPKTLLPRKEQQIRNTRYVECEWAPTQTLPAGYHYLQLEIDNKTHKTLLIAAPTKAHFPFKRREWGVFAPMYALHSGQNPNGGTLREFEWLMKWMLDHGGRIAATLPLLAAFLDSPFEPSPYSPASRLFWNEFYVDAGKSSSSRPRKSDLVDYRREARARRAVLEKQASTFVKNRDSHDYASFTQFVRRNPELTQYARFRAVTEKEATGWAAWPSRLRDGRIAPRDYDEKVEQYHLYAQWRIQSQLRSMADNATRDGQLLYLDLPLGLHPDSYDIWRYRDLFVREAAGGAPPDPVFTKGQNWGFPPMHPEASRRNHYKYTIAYIRNHLQNARLLRIDHVMGLHRLFWIPQGFTGDKGVYVSYPADEMYAILSLESHRNQAGIVGENLGTVPPEVNTSMRRHNIQQMFVVQYELEGKDPEKALQGVPKNTVASLNTHDMFPFRAFLTGTDIEDRLDLGFLDPSGTKTERSRRSRMKKLLTGILQEEELLPTSGKPTPVAVFKATMRHLAASPANIVLLNLDDVLGETLPQNVPATQKERPNWRRLARMDMERIEESSQASETLKTVEQGRR